jgi:hypothetical protein
MTSRVISDPCLCFPCSYIEDKLRAKQLLISKLQEKNDLLQAQITDAEHQLTCKKDLADILHAVDFDQLTIQNQQLMNKIRDKTHEFHRMKGRSNKALQVHFIYMLLSHI